MNRFRSDVGSGLVDVLGYGPIVFASDDLGDDPILITVNGSYLNWWNPVGQAGRWSNDDCRNLDLDNGLYGLTVARAMDLAKAWYEEIVNGVDENEDEATE